MSLLQQLRGSCNNRYSGNVTITSNDGDANVGTSDGCSGRNYHGLQNLVVFTGKLTNEPTLLNGLPVSDMNGVRLGRPFILPLMNLVACPVG